MPVIAVINRKGGSGKSTLATHLAAWMAHHGLSVMLGDVDRQQSTRAWLKRRAPELPPIMPWTIDQKNVLKVPTGVTHVVLDTPGGIHGFELAKVVMSADAIIMPVCQSMFDRESAQACHAELSVLPRVASGRCRLGVVGMRIDARTKAGDSLQEWAKGLNVPFVGVLRETQLYVKCLDTGQTLFDVKGFAGSVDQLQWEPILEWIRPAAKLLPAPQPSELFAVNAPVHEPAKRPHTPRPASLMPAQESFVHGDRLGIIASAKPPSQADLAPHDDLSFGRHSHDAARFTAPQFPLRH
ncbi:ParA family protein [Rhodoferax aquaticus]|uniref:ParA family protein n=1 Tax=Rhodoferax aquaticus TaxID=2527691 RepID=A0A515EMX0_9BURK|nr:ParA family protein [Rhodoferax aquaticus]QDL53978.1 ParA family protein [Rhodoferax aquaticus]